MHEDILEFLSRHPLCVIATSGANNRPEAAYVGLTYSKNLEIVIGTSNKTRKYANIVSNPMVAIVVADMTAEIQYEGEASIINNEEYLELVENGEIEDLFGIEKYRDDPTQVYIKIVPKWIRFIQHKQTNIVTEFTEF